MGVGGLVPGSAVTAARTLTDADIAAIAEATADVIERRAKLKRRLRRAPEQRPAPIPSDIRAEIRAKVLGKLAR